MIILKFSNNESLWFINELLFIDNSNSNLMSEM